MPARIDVDAVLRLGPVLAAAGVALGRAGFSERGVKAWLGAPLVSDARYVVGRSERAVSRWGAAAMMALLVAGETVERSELRALDDAQLDALVAVGLLAREGATIAARGSLVPLAGILVAADRLDDDAAGAVSSPDVSAWNVASSFAPRPRRLLDVGTGAGAVALVAARAGACAVGTDFDGRALDWARLNARLNGIAESSSDDGERGSVRFVAGDLYAGVPGRFDALVFNAPLLRAPLAGESPLYLAAPRGATLAIEFLDGAAAHLAPAPEAEVLCHTQLSPAVEEAVARAPLPRGVTLRFAHAVDGTPHALVSLRAAGDPSAPAAPPYRASLATPLGPALAPLRRELFDRLHATQELLSGDDDALLHAVLRPAPWLSLERRATHDGAAFTLRALRFGDEPLDPSDVALLEACDGRPLHALATTPETHARLRFLAERGLLVT